MQSWQRIMSQLFALTNALPMKIHDSVDYGRFFSTSWDPGGHCLVAARRISRPREPVRLHGRPRRTFPKQNTSETNDRRTFLDCSIEVIAHPHTEMAERHTKIPLGTAPDVPEKLK
jgi:hypothetical protein